MTAAQSNPVLAEITSLRRELALTWEAHLREHESHEKAHAREHEFAAEAIKTAAVLAQENKADANEWRASMNDREARFATKADTHAILGRLDTIERSDIVRDERDRTRILDDAEDKRQTERRQARSQWTVGLVVGFIATIGAVLVNLVIRLLGS